MKKSLAFVLMIGLTLFLPTTAFASETIGPNTETGSTTITYNVDPAYLVTIPSTVTLGGAAVSVTAEDVVVEKGKQVVVTLDGTSEDGNALAVSYNGESLTYKINIDDVNKTQVNVGDTVLSVNPEHASSGSVSLNFSAPEKITYAGEYTGTVTFKIAVDSLPPS